MGPCHKRSAARRAACCCAWCFYRHGAPSLAHRPPPSPPPSTPTPISPTTLVPMMLGAGPLLPTTLPALPPWGVAQALAEEVRL